MSLSFQDAGTLTRQRYHESPSFEASLPLGGFFQVSGMGTRCHSGAAGLRWAVSSVTQARVSKQATDPAIRRREGFAVMVRIRLVMAFAAGGRRSGGVLLLSDLAPARQPPDPR